MKRWHAVSMWCFLWLVGCIGGEPGAGAAADPVAVQLHALSATPGCYVPPPALEDDGSMAAQMRQMQELNLELNLQYVVLLVETILADPFAERWELVYQRGELTTVVGVALVVKDEAYAELAVESYTEGWLAVSMTEKEWVSTTSTSAIVADELESSLDSGAFELRWSDRAFAWTQPSGNTAEPVTTSVRGCDPERQISFAQGYQQPLHCWLNATGDEVSCAGVQLWP